MKPKIIEYSDPPQRGDVWRKKLHANPWETLRTRLEERPGEWALISLTDKPRMGLGYYTKKYGIQFTCRQTIRGTSRKRLRYGTWARVQTTTNKKKAR